MTSIFNGTWKLTSAENLQEFLKSTGFTESQMKQVSPIDDPSNDVTFRFNIAGDTLERALSVNGKQYYTEKCTFGVEREVNSGAEKCKMLTRMEGDVLVDIMNNTGLKEFRYERTVVGDKMIQITRSSSGNTAKKVFIKQ